MNDVTRVYLSKDRQNFMFCVGLEVVYVMPWRDYLKEFGLRAASTMLRTAATF
jgi:hypothetical protein